MLCVLLLVAVIHAATIENAHINFDRLITQYEVVVVKFCVDHASGCTTWKKDWAKLTKRFLEDRSVLTTEVDCAQQRAFCKAQKALGYV